MNNPVGLRHYLKIPFVYDFFQEITGGNAWRRMFIRDYVNINPGEKVVEIGCGPGQLLPWLKDVEYIGFDPNQTYIEAATKKYGNRGLFLLGNTHTLAQDPRLSQADVVICCGILHHLDDEQVSHAVKFAYQILKVGGRFVCGEPCRLPDQGRLSKWIMSRDRGQYIRFEAGYRELIGGAFSSVKWTLDLKPLRMPSSNIIIQGQK